MKHLIERFKRQRRRKRMTEEFSALAALKKPTFAPLYDFWLLLDKKKIGEKYSPEDGRIPGKYFHSPSSLLETMSVVIQNLQDDTVINPAYLTTMLESHYFEEWFLTNGRYIAMSSFLVLLERKLATLNGAYRSAMLTRRNKITYYDRCLAGVCNDLKELFLVLYQVEQHYE